MNTSSPNIEELEAKKDIVGLIEAMRIGGQTGERAKDALMRMGEPAVGPLIQVFWDRDIHLYIMEILGYIGDPRAIEPLVDRLRLGTGNRIAMHERAMAAETLGKIGNGRAVKPLIEKAVETDYIVPPAAYNAILAIGEPAIEPLIKYLDDDRQNIREKAERALLEMGGPAVDTFVKILSDFHSDPQIRAIPIKSFGKSIREIAIESLRISGDERALEPLISILRDDDDDNIRAKAASALGEIRDEKERALEPLTTALNDESHTVGGTAKAALRKIEKIKKGGGFFAKPKGYVGTFFRYSIFPGLLSYLLFTLVWFLIGIFGLSNENMSAWEMAASALVLVVSGFTLVFLILAFFWKASTISLTFEDKEAFLQKLNGALRKVKYRLKYRTGGYSIYTFRSDNPSLIPAVNVHIEGNSAKITGPRSRIKKLEKRLR